MNINTVGKTTYTEPYKKISEKEVSGEKESQVKTASADRKDTFVKTTQDSAGVYTKPSRLSSDDLMKMEEQRLESFQKLLQSMVAKQGEKSNLSLFGQNLNVTAANSANAAAAIAPGGEYSVDAVATRILDMAKALAGDDTSKVGMLKEAVQKGFKAAGVDLGGKLPSICNDTYDEVMKRFDEWEKELAGLSTD